MLSLLKKWKFLDNSNSWKIEIEISRRSLFQMKNRVRFKYFPHDCRYKKSIKCRKHILGAHLNNCKTYSALWRSDLGWRRDGGKIHYKQQYGCVNEQYGLTWLSKQILAEREIPKSCNACSFRQDENRIRLKR